MKEIERSQWKINDELKEIETKWAQIKDIDKKQEEQRKRLEEGLKDLEKKKKELRKPEEQTGKKTGPILQIFKERWLPGGKEETTKPQKEEDREKETAKKAAQEDLLKLAQEHAKKKEK